MGHPAFRFSAQDLTPEIAAAAGAPIAGGASGAPAASLGGETPASPLVIIINGDNPATISTNATDSGLRATTLTFRTREELAFDTGSGPEGTMSRKRHNRARSMAQAHTHHGLLCACMRHAPEILLCSR
jgi:hypothetical protein